MRWHPVGLPSVYPACMNVGGHIQSSTAKLSGRSTLMRLAQEGNLEAYVWLPKALLKDRRTPRVNRPGVTP